MNQYIVITSIFHPTPAVQQFAKVDTYNLIVVGDKKSPQDWSCHHVKYLSVQYQEKLAFELARVLPYNHYSRKMLGYLEAMALGADVIVDTDDDNLPKNTWDFPSFSQTYDSVAEGLGFVNIYQLYTKQKIWPRGLPLRFIKEDFELERKLIKKQVNVGVWQGLADEDPDVDAIYRLTDDTPCIFEERNPIVLSPGTISPFNSQNTLFRKELFSLLYLPAYVSFRFTDILRGLVAQPIMWLYGYELGFTKATVNQKRNPHDYTSDFISEIPMYTEGEKVVELVSKSISASDGIATNLFNAYNTLLKNKIVPPKEIETLEAWLNDIERLK